MPSVKRRLFCRSPHLVGYWADGELVLHNFATGVRIAADALVCAILDFFDGWRSVDDLARHLPHQDRRSVRRLVNALTRHSLLQSNGRPASPEEQAMRSFARWNPAAGFFHASTKDVRYSDVNVVDRFLRRQARSWPMPAPVKRYPKARSVWLPRPSTDGELARVLLARRTWRRFSRRPLDVRKLATLLGLTGSVLGWTKVPGQGMVAFKTSPSGGARHPIEIYVLALRVSGLSRGLYHYAADRHALELLRPGADPKQVVKYLPTEQWCRSASALVFLTAVFPRNLWRYPYARAYRAVLIEAGHVCQTFCLAATWLGLAPFCSMALADSRIERDLRIDGVTESVLYAAGVGTRPPGVAWAPMPQGGPRIRTFPNRHLWGDKIPAFSHE